MSSQPATNRPCHTVLRGSPVQFVYHLSAEAYDRLTANGVDPKLADQSVLIDLAHEIDEYDNESRISACWDFASPGTVIDYTSFGCPS